MLTARITDDWLPLPEPVLRALNWREGDIIELVVADGVLVATLTQLDSKVVTDGNTTGP